MPLSERQQRILEFIKQHIEEHKFPPSIREIGAAVNISSTSVVNYNLKKLEAAGYIERDRDVSRGIRLLEPALAATATEDRSVRIRLLGRIPAGEPVPVPDEDPFIRETLELTDLLSLNPQEVYALQVTGNSMIDALVDDGDYIIVRYQQTARDGDMVVAWLRDREETTLKYFYQENGNVRLQPANNDYKPIVVPADQVQIQGKVIAIIRRVQGDRPKV